MKKVKISFEMSKLDMRIEEYKRKIDAGEFTIDDVYSFVEDLKRLNFIDNSLTKRIERIKGIIADYYLCEESQVYIGNLDLATIKSGRITIPYKVIIGKVDFRNCKLVNLEQLRMIGRDTYIEIPDIEQKLANTSSTRKYVELGDLEIIQGDVYFQENQVEHSVHLGQIAGSRFWGIRSYLDKKSEERMIQRAKSAKKDDEITAREVDTTETEKVDVDLIRNQRLSIYEFIQKIETGRFTKRDVPDFIARYKRGNDIDIAYREQIEKIRGVIAEYFNCSKEEIYIGDIDFKETNFETVPYRVIFGNATFTDSRVRKLDTVYIGGNVDFRNSYVSIFENLIGIGGNVYLYNSAVRSFQSVKNIGGDANLQLSELEDLGDLMSIGGVADFTASKVKSIGKLIKILGEVKWGERTDLKQQYEEKRRKIGKKDHVDQDVML